MPYMHKSWILIRYMDYSKLVKFILTGFINTIFGYTVYAILIFLKIPYMISLAISTGIGVVFNYFSFGRIFLKPKNNSEWLSFIKFVFAYFLIYLLNLFVLTIAIGIFLLNPYIGQIIALPITVFISWMLMNHWVYLGK